jgi:trans-aconitate methyltransferase
MLPKPKHLGPEYAAQFTDAAIVAAYHHRPPYPAGVFDILAALAIDEPRAVLDIGCGTGDVARPLAAKVARLDAVDRSTAMIEKGRGLPGGDRPNLAWIVGDAEDAPLRPSYALITAGESLHWMAWEIVMPRFQRALTPRGCLALVSRTEAPPPWRERLGPIIQRYSTNRDYQPYNIVDELERRALFQKLGVESTAPVAFTQSITSYIESFHSRNGLSRDRLTAAAAAAFDDEVRRLVTAFCGDGEVTLQITGRVVWGRPLDL